MDITALTEVGSAIKGVLEAYAKALPNLIKEVKEDETYSDTKMRMILCAVEQCKGEIDQKIAEYDRKISDKAAGLEQLKWQKTDAEKQYEQSKTELENKQKKFDYWKNLQSDIEKKLKEIQDLKTQIEKEDDLSHAASMYFLALELQRTLRSTNIVCTQDLKEQLYTAWNELSQAKELVRDKKSTLDAATAALDTAQKELDELKQKRRENILEKVAVVDQRIQQKKYPGAK
jgi:hypothetical protein